jgi:hypothetical protein
LLVAGLIAAGPGPAGASGWSGGAGFGDMTREGPVDGGRHLRIKFILLGAGLGPPPLTWNSDAYPAELASWPIDLQVTALELAVGTGLGPVDVAIGTRCLDGYLSQLDSAPDMGLAFPIYAHVLTQQKDSKFAPTFYGFAGVNLPTFPHYVNVGAGLQWTFWVVSPAVEASYRHEFGLGRWDDFLTLQLKLGLGGWYRVGAESQ